jgi:hypothetical protein
MEVSEPLDVLFAQISAIKNCFNSNGKTKVQEKMLIVIVHEVAPPKYAPMLSGLKILKGSAIMLDNIQVAMHMHWGYLSAQQQKAKE